jgi:hypothetical protein
MDAFTMIVLVVAITKVCRLIHFALQRRGDLRAGARFGPGSFFLEVREKKSGSRELPR